MVRVSAILRFLPSTDEVNQSWGCALPLTCSWSARWIDCVRSVFFFHLQRLRTVRRSLTKESMPTLVHEFVTSRIDHCNSVLYGLSAYLFDRLQLVIITIIMNFYSPVSKH